MRRKINVNQVKYKKLGISFLTHSVCYLTPVAPLKVKVVAFTILVADTQKSP